MKTETEFKMKTKTQKQKPEAKPNPQPRAQLHNYLFHEFTFSQQHFRSRAFGQCHLAPGVSPRPITRRSGNPEHSRGNPEHRRAF